MSKTILVNDFGDNTGTVEVTVGLTRRFRFRIWLGLNIMRIGALIVGLGFDLRHEDAK